MCACIPPAWPADTASSITADAEVEGLLADLQASACRFKRNGRWYDGQQARQHLTMKWRELQRRRLAGGVEQFIEHAASRSALTGEPYEVQCAAQPAQPSAVWLMSRLQALRSRVP